MKSKLYICSDERQPKVITDHSLHSLAPDYIHLYNVMGSNTETHQVKIIQFLK